MWSKTSTAPSCITATTSDHCCDWVYRDEMTLIRLVRNHGFFLSCYRCRWVKSNIFIAPYPLCGQGAPSVWSHLF